jgi:hypothetical protein
MESEQRATARRVGGAGAAAVLLCDLADDRETEPAALMPARVRAAEEAVEDVWKILVGDALAVVADLDTAGVDRDLDQSPGIGVARRVVEQVVDRPAESLADAVD